MGMSRILVMFGSHFGETRTIATRVAQRLRGSGHDIDLVDVRLGTDHVRVEDYDAVVFGSRIEFGRCAPHIIDYVRSNRAALEQRPTAFFAVSMSASDGPQGIGHDASGYMATLFEDLRWRPQLAAAF